MSGVETRFENGLIINEEYYRWWDSYDSGMFEMTMKQVARNNGKKAQNYYLIGSDSGPEVSLYSRYSSIH